MNTTLYKELNDKLAEGATGGAGWSGPYEHVDGMYDENGDGTVLDEWYKYDQIGPYAINLDKVKRNPYAYLTETYFGDTYYQISFKYEAQQPRQSSVSPHFRFVPLSA